MSDKKYFCSGCMDHLASNEISISGPATMAWCYKKECRKKARQAGRYWPIFAYYILMKCQAKLPEAKS
jgi:hypothetical protein